MNKKALRILEYDKIKELLAAECMSGMTREEAGRLLPSCDAAEIGEELEKTAEAMEVLLKKSAPPLGNFYDISGLARLASKDGMLTQRQLLQVGYNLASARRTKSFLGSDLPELRYIDEHRQTLSELKQLEGEIERCVISEDEIADSASSELRRIRNSILRQNEAIKSKLSQIVSSSANREILQDSIVTLRQGRYVIPVKLEHKARVPGIVHDQSASGATLFIEPQSIVDMNNELRELELAEQQEILRILRELSAMVGAEELRIRANQEILVKLDFMFAKARLAYSMNAMRPSINDRGLLELSKARHPLIDKKKVVPVDIALGGSYRTLVITGPNTGGKTVTLKTAGLLCLMAQSGLFIPASDGSTVPVYRDIFADIGDEQSIEQSLSTFSSHMSTIVGIVRHAGTGCLVLLDELGAGTDPTEGAALAISILDHLYRRGASTLATTHYTELKKYAISTEGVENASMQFDVETLSPTYRLMIGIPGKSNAFEISRKLGLPEKIISAAGNYLESGDIAFEDVLRSIEDDKKEAEAKLAEAEKIKSEMAGQKARMDDLEKRYARQKELLMEEAREEARALVEEARAEVAAVQKEIADAREYFDDVKAEAAEKELSRSIEAGKRRLKERQSRYSSGKKPQSNDHAPSAEQIVPGIRVNVLSVDQKGTVLSEPDDKGDFSVQVGPMKLKVNVKDVSVVKENVTKKEKEKLKYSRMYVSKSLSVPMSVNVIGKTLDDAELLVDKYIDDAFMAGLETVSVIHGRGTGTLKAGLQAMLKKNKHVASLRSGSMGEGGDGVTIVTLKK